MAVTADTYFAQIPEWVLYADISSHAVRVYGVLRRYADKNGAAHPSRKTIAEHINVSIDTVKRALSELEELGAMERIPRFSDGRQTSNNYHLISHPRGGTLAPPEGGSLAPGEGGTGDPGGTIASMNQSHRNQSYLFDEFWSVYPLHKDKAHAKAAFEKACARAAPADIIAGALAYANDPTRDPTKTKYAQGWLNGDRWEDEMVDPQEAALRLLRGGTA